MTDVSPDLSFGTTWPNLETFQILAKDRRVIPVVRRLMADAETRSASTASSPRTRPGTFLLESAEHGGVWSRYSIVGAASRATLTEKDGRAHWVGEPPVGVPTDGNPLEALRDTVAALATEPIEGLPPLTGGMVGAITYDAVRRWERVPDTLPDELGLPEISMMLATDLAVLDHSDGSVLLVANAVNYDATDERVEDAWADAVARLDAMTSDLAAAGAEHGGDGRPRRVRRRPRRGAQQPHAGRLRGDGRAGEGGHPRRRGLPGRSLATVLDAVPRPTPSTSTGRCARPTRAPTCTSCGSRPVTARPTTSSARRRRRS